MINGLARFLGEDTVLDGQIDGQIRAILFQLLLDRDRGTAR